MKKYIYIAKFSFSVRLISLALLLIALSFHSCDLNEYPKTGIKEDEFFVGVSNLDYAVLALYQPLQNTNTYGLSMSACLDTDTDIEMYEGAAAPTGNIQRDMSKSYIMTNNTITQGVWQLFYAGINKANLILAHINEVPVTKPADEILIKKLEAETKFLRAFYYFDLVRFFGDIPLITKPTKYNDNFMVMRTPKDSVYAQIVKDLQEAIPNLNWHTKEVYNGRVTKSAALGILAKVQLFRGGYSLYQDGNIKRPDDYKTYYQEVLNNTKILIDSAKHSLNPSYEKVFYNQCRYELEPQETIFEIDLYYAANSSSGGQIGSVNTPIYAQNPDNIPNIYNRTQSYMKTNYIFASKFGAGDLRRDVSIADYSVDVKGNRVTYITYKDKAKTVISNYNSQSWTINKWRREWQTADQFKSVPSTSINFVVMRYSDVLLMRAEALNEINEGPTAEAYELVNQVRRRGYGKPIFTADVAVDMPTGLTKQKFLEYIQDERARELAFEGGRRQDLIRWNILKDKILELNAFYQLPANKIFVKTGWRFIIEDLFVPGKHELYPNPQRERTENSMLTQNPGYGS